MTTPRDALAAALATLLDPENAPARHGAWHALHRAMGEHSVELVDDDGCSLWVEPWEIAVLVNDAVDRLAAPDPAPLDVERLDIRWLLDNSAPMHYVGCGDGDCVCGVGAKYDAIIDRQAAREYAARDEPTP